MLETKNTKVQEILKEIHRKVHQKAGRMDRMSTDIVLENLAVQALCSNMKLSPGACREVLKEKFACSCSDNDMIRIYRDFKINSFDKRQEIFVDATGIVVLLEKSMNGDKQAFALYRSTMEKFMEKRPDRFYRIILMMAFCNIPALQQEKDRELITNLGNTLCKYLVYDIENAITYTYGFNKHHSSAPSKNDNTPKTKSPEQERLLQKLASLESALEQSDMLLRDLQNEFDERLEAVKLQEMTEFFGKLNSDKYGCILDELLMLRKGMDAVKKSGYVLPLEINGLLIMVRKLVQFLRDSHIDPMLKPESLRTVKAGDIEFWNYEGKPFVNAEEEKQVKVISPGWIYSEKQVQISRPKVKEVVEDVD